MEIDTNKLRISLVQAAISWENKTRNTEHYGHLLEKLSGKSDLAVLPEMFSTGFSMRAGHLAETNEDATIVAIRSWAKNFGFAVCGSFLAKDESGRIFNRGFFITPQGDSYFYDKRHLFRMGEENKQFTAGDRILIIPYKTWKIRLIICYDLRFPVWNRNTDNAYDLLICPANWPIARANVWQVLLQARALENQSYVCGVNRIGEDGLKIPHQGDSVLLDFKGNTVIETVRNSESVVTGTIQKDFLETFRKKFPAWMDADRFEIK
ncbi:MAG: nitrilase family protein [Candidatus Symbiothrix sp.]|jgi:predicted amidohydrolase|nr:nitrilase family protein [Candidatus Symbiothrix sp.]